MVFPVCLVPEASLVTGSCDANRSTTAAFSGAIDVDSIGTPVVQSQNLCSSFTNGDITYLSPSPLYPCRIPLARRHLMTKDKLLACEPGGGELDIVRFSYTFDKSLLLAKARSLPLARFRFSQALVARRVCVSKS